MRAVVQRVSEASVRIDGETVGAIQNGLCVLLGVSTDDTEADADYITEKLLGLRIFDDENGVMNRSVVDISGRALVVSQFTLHASTKKGNRPSYIRAARPEHATPLYELFCERLSQAIGSEVGRGVFGADMQVALINDGPVTICIDSQNRE